ncbi:MAG: CHAD domain-containing protein [Actinomycetes bacterium]
MTEPTSSLEVERKLTVPDDFSLNDVAQSLESVGRLQREKPRNLVAVYYDTDDYRLARSHITLRRRTGGDDSGWHLKLPSDLANGNGRQEVALPLDAGRPGSVPEALVGRLVALTGGAQLKPLATQETRRLPITVIDDQGAPGVEVVDDSVSVTTGPQTGLAYREIEVEVLTNPKLLEETVRTLTAAGAMPATSMSKGVRALVGDVQLPPLVDAGPRPKPKDPASDAIAYSLRTQVAAIIEQDQRIRGHLPDAVHQYRVAARRLRSVLQAFESLVDEQWARAMRAELGWIASVLSQARDREVLEARLVDAVRNLPIDVDGAAALVTIERHLKQELDVANATIDEVMASPRYRDLMIALHAASVVAPTTPEAQEKASAVLPPLVEARWKKLKRDARRLHDELEGHDDHWHQARKSAKKARYTVEACVPVFGGPAKRFAKELESVTELLGEHQDASIAASLMQQLSTTARGARATFAMGVLFAQQREQVGRCRNEFIDIWPRVGHPEWRKWLAAKK